MNPCFKEVLKRSDGELGCYAAALPLPRSVIVDYFSCINKWVVNSGKEWTVSRCKDIYTDWIRYKAGLPAVGKWYSKGSDGLPSGVIGFLFRHSNSSKKARFAVSTLLRSYTTWVSPEATEKQLKKFLDGVHSEPISIPNDIVEGVRKAARKVVGRLVVGDPAPYWIYQPSTGKRVPHWNGKTYPEEEYWNSQYLTLYLTKTGSTIRSKYSSILKHVLNGESGSFQSSYEDSGWDGWSNGHTKKGNQYDYVGKIGLIQEPGFKLRAVANPNRVYQAMLKPLGDALYHKLVKLPWDCTHDQSKSNLIVQEHLSKGLQVHCIDLSGATDYFPLSLQTDVLKECVVSTHDYIGLFSMLSRSPWNFQGDSIHWTKGQPLGLYPSFASFALTHGLLLFYLNDFKHNNAFFVLGDDVILLDDSLNQKYRECLEILQCPVSEAKTLSSNICGEFAGKLIFTDDILPQLKWRHISDDNFIDVVRLLGPRGLHILRSRQRSVVSKVQDIPEFLGGLGFNPKGLPLEDRVEKYLNMVSPLTGSYRMGYDDHLNRYFYNDKVIDGIQATHHYDGITQIPDLDQRSLSLVLKHAPTLYKWSRIMGTNLYSILDGNIDVLPIDGSSSKRTSLLERLERKLN